MKKYLFISAFLLVVLNAKAQSSCDLINYVVNPKASACGAFHDYSVHPDSTHTPIKYVRISFNIFQRANGTGSFIAPDDTIKSYFKAMIDSANYRLAHIQIINPATSSPNVIDSRVRFLYNNTYIYKDDNLYNYTSLPNTHDVTVADSIYYNVIQQRTDLSTIDKANTLHIILVPGGTNCCGGRAKGYSTKEWVHLRGYDYAFNWSNGGPPITVFGPAIHGSVGHLIHEVCHSLGLKHDFQNVPAGINVQSPQCDEFSDNGCPDYKTSNNYMDYTEPYYNRTALSEDQIAKIHYCLMGNQGSIDADVVQDYCQYNASQSMTIGSGQNIVWAGGKNLLGDLNINSGGSLTVKCNVSVPFGGKVKVNSGGKLIIQTNGNFLNSCGDVSSGIEVLDGGYLELNNNLSIFTNVSTADYNIKVRSGGSIRINGNLYIAGNRSITVESGGYFCIQQSPPNFSINLVDFNSVINLKCGYINGVNPIVTGITSNCVANLATYVSYGLGKINAASFLTDVYIQNTTLTGNQYITGNNIYIGSNVTTGTQGPVYIGNGANIIFNACGDVTIPKDFDNPATNSTLEIAPQ